MLVTAALAALTAAAVVAASCSRLWRLQQRSCSGRPCALALRGESCEYALLVLPALRACMLSPHGAWSSTAAVLCAATHRCSNVPYPRVYAEGDSPEATKFNCMQASSCWRQQQCVLPCGCVPSAAAVTLTPCCLCAVLHSARTKTRWRRCPRCLQWRHWW